MDWALSATSALASAQTEDQSFPLAVLAMVAPAVAAMAPAPTAPPLPVRPLIKLWIRFLPHCTACEGRLLIQASALEKPPLKAFSMLVPMLLTPFATPVRMFLPMFSQFTAEKTESTACRIFFQLASRSGTAFTIPTPSCTTSETPSARSFGMLSLMMPQILMMISGT